MRERGTQSRRVRDISVEPVRRPGPPPRGGTNFWQALAIVALIAATAGWTTVAVLALRGPAGAAAVASEDPNASADASTAPDVPSHDVPALEAFLPTSVKGTALDAQSVTGDDGLIDPTRRRCVERGHHDLPDGQVKGRDGPPVRLRLRPGPGDRHQRRRLSRHWRRRASPPGRPGPGLEGPRPGREAQQRDPRWQGRHEGRRRGRLPVQLPVCPGGPRVRDLHQRRDARDGRTRGTARPGRIAGAGYLGLTRRPRNRRPSASPVASPTP